MEGETFRSVMSRGILVFYLIVSAFILVAIGLPVIKADMSQTEQALFVVFFLLVLALMSGIIIKGYKMKFVVTDTQVIIDGMFKKNMIDVHDIESVEKSPIPFGFRLFGASLLGGFYYLPGIGFAWVSMGNFKDGVMIKTRGGKNFVITPENPERFVETVKSKTQQRVV